MLDAFAGSGALGFEAASRGAAEVQLLERDPLLARSLQASQARLQATALRVECADALAWMARSAPARFDLVLLDPPFDAGLQGAALAAAAPLGTMTSPRWLASASTACWTEGALVPNRLVMGRR